MNIQTILRSSENPAQLSMTIKGILTGLVVVASMVGIIPADAMKDVSQVTELLVTGIQAILGALATIWTVYGGLRKIYNLYFKNK